MSGALLRGRDRADAPGRSGPRTPGGKGRSARNAFRHGLSVPVLGDPVTARAVEALTLRIAPDADADAEAGALARRVAQAQMDLVRVRRKRHELLAEALGNIGGGRRPEDAKLAARASPSQHSDQISKLLSDLASRLAAMHRYERDALSRRKFAIRDFDAAFVPRITKRTRKSSTKTVSARIAADRTSEAQRSRETGSCPELQNEPENHQ
jgi:hypothetical protein